MKKQRTIIVPKDKNAENLLDFDNAKLEQLLELQLDESNFEKLHKEGIFDLINKISKTNIDDYENESIQDKDKIKKVIDELTVKENFVSTELKENVIEIRKLFQEALERGVGVYFYF